MEFGVMKSVRTVVKYEAEQCGFIFSIFAASIKVQFMWKTYIATSRVRGIMKILRLLQWHLME